MRDAYEEVVELMDASQVVLDGLAPAGQPQPADRIASLRSILKRAEHFWVGHPLRDLWVAAQEVAYGADPEARRPASESSQEQLRDALHTAARMLDQRPRPAI